MEPNTNSMKKLGRGSYGNVYGDGNLAWKRFDNSYDDSGIRTAVIREMASLSLLKGQPYICKPISYFLGDYFIYSSMEKYKIDLLVYTRRLRINNNINYWRDKSNMRKFLHQILTAMACMEKYNIVHRDLKHRNIFVDKFDNFYLGDFGLAHPIIVNSQIQLSGNVQTVTYRASELILGNRVYNIKIDMWSLAILVYELVNGNYVTQYDIKTILQKTFNLLGVHPMLEEKYHKSFTFDTVPFKNIYPGMSDEFLSLMENIYTYDLDKRFKPSEALNHPYFHLVSKKK